MENSNPEYMLKPSTHIDSIYIFRWENEINAYCTSDIKELQKIKKTNGEWDVYVNAEFLIPNDKGEYVIKVRVLEIETQFTDEKRSYNDSTQRGDDNDYYNRIVIKVQKV